jgi:membrane protease YdiL (CAAX protease family)
MDQQGPTLQEQEQDQEQDLLMREELGDIPCRPSRTELVLEVSVFLFLIVPSMVLSYFAVGQDKINFVVLALSTIFRDLALLSLILFFAWRDKEPLRRLGLTRDHLAFNLALGLALYAPFLFVIGAVEQVLTGLGLSSGAQPGPSYFHVGGRWELALAVILVAVVAVSEETIFRGYLIRRLQMITASTPAAVLLSSIVFALGHGYEGSLGVVTVGVMGLVFSLLYLWRRSLIVPIVLHFIQDFLAIVVAPYLQ